MRVRNRRLAWLISPGHYGRSVSFHRPFPGLALQPERRYQHSALLHGL